MPRILGQRIQPEVCEAMQTMAPETPIEKAILENRIGMYAICDEKKGYFDYWIAGPYMGGEVPEG